tara:strand:- start:2884 stop:3288 length:405 start_codon:yes stop_codon:yes gene_type:complete
MINKTAIERRLETAWAATTNAAELERLRVAFENLALGWDAPVLVSKLTETQVARIDDAFPEDTSILASGKSWILFETTSAVEDIIGARDLMADDAIDMALNNCYSEMTDAKDAFITRTATRSVDNMVAKLKRAI